MQTWHRYLALVTAVTAGLVVVLPFAIADPPGCSPQSGCTEVTDPQTGTSYCVRNPQLCLSSYDCECDKLAGGYCTCHSPL